MILNFFKILIGIALIICGGILEIMWLGFLFGSVLGVVLVLVFAPHYFVMPWTFFVAAGMSFIGSTDDNLPSNFEHAKKASSNLLKVLLKIIKFSILIIVLVFLGAGIYHLYEKKKMENLENKMAQEKQDKINAAKLYNKEWHVLYERDPASGKRIARTAYVTSEDGLCELSVQKRVNGNELTGLDCIGVTIYPYSDINIKFDKKNVSKSMNLQKYTDSDGVYISSYNQYSMTYESFIIGLINRNRVAIEIPVFDSFWATFTLKGSSRAINSLGKEVKE